MENKKIYVGNGKENKQYGFVNFSVCLDDLPQEHINEYKGKKYINLTISKKKEVDAYGKTHAVSVNTWVKDNVGNNSTPTAAQAEDDLPF